MVLYNYNFIKAVCCWLFESMGPSCSCLFHLRIPQPALLPIPWSSQVSAPLLWLLLLPRDPFPAPLLLFIELMYSSFRSQLGCHLCRGAVSAVPKYPFPILPIILPLSCFMSAEAFVTFRTILFVSIFITLPFFPIPH